MFNKLKKVATLPTIIAYLFTAFFGTVPFSYAENSDEQVFYYLHDNLGGIDAVVDENGKVVERNDYLPFGSDRIQTQPTTNTNNYGFTGKELDDETGLYYYGARYYDPEIGRFTQIDPLTLNKSEKSLESILTNPQQLNSYSYVNNRPLNYIDENGMIPKIGLSVSKFISVATYGGFGTENGWLAQSAKDYINNPNSQTQSSLVNSQSLAFERLLLDPFFSDETWDPVSTERISGLDPKVRVPATDFINKVEAKQNVQLRVTTGYRGVEEQNRLYEQGRTQTGNIVTWVKGGDSYHNYGRAIDVAKMENGGVLWEKITNTVADIAKDLGFKWGGDWKTPDYPHFQMTFGESTKNLKKKDEK